MLRIVCESLSDITLSKYEAEYNRHVPDAIHQHPSDNLICLLQYMLQLVSQLVEPNPENPMNVIGLRPLEGKAAREY